MYYIHSILNRILLIHAKIVILYAKTSVYIISINYE